MAAPRFELIGTPFSTFTRSVAMALKIKKLEFSWNPVTPHSTGKTHNYLGFIPVLYDHQESIKLTECLAILSYLDRISDSPTLFTPFLSTQIPEKILELTSFASSHLFRAVEFGVVKPIVFDLGVTEGNPLKEILSTNLPILQEVLEALELLLSTEEAAPYAVGLRISAADLVLLPPLLDLKCLPEGKLLNSFVRISAWMVFMEELDCVKETREGTLAEQREGEE